ncbi:PREDICTED: valine--tRNA ligase, mitochondrial-like isoform X1 [Trachymyrmex septentrionalis]|uniref:valine--tRNA ligase, mitochondrial-like isoform X1 n=1 Tax=Trachymyrmex septentrionalis TaxID=34720 RepID=UPI00084EEBDF|nr:PREDICTED: valine--tRNA ligase, mitochondrial-like isoform X1 [Trachymyrmex septentrionalis]
MKYTLFNHPFLHVNFCYQTLRYCTSTATATELCNYKRLADFPAIFKPKDVENGWYDTWQRNKYFASSRTTNSTQEEKETKEPFSMVLPPPNITGILHLGHALTVIIQDVLARWHRMKGHPVLWIPGLDHAGIATQAIVERTLQHTRNITRYDMGRDEFTQLIWQWKAEKAAVIKQQLKTLGATLDWDREYFTIDKSHSAAVTETFVRLYERNLLYRARDLVNWSPALRSTISDIEVEDFVVNGKTRLQLPGYNSKITVGQLIKLVYPIKDSKEELIIATTRPETIFGDVAIAVHPNDDRYSRYIGQYVLHPIRETFIPIIADSSVKREFGTGAVKITPAHDRLDYNIAKRHNLPVICVIDEGGNMTDACKEFKGVPRFITRKRLMDQLSVRGLVKGVEDNHRMTLPLCSRTHDVIEYLPKEQWFLRCTAMAKRAHKAVANGELKIYPSEDSIYEQMWYNWLENYKHRDWCVSRQLWWGHRIPAYSIIHDDGKDNDNDIFSDSDNTTSWIIARSEEEARSLAQEKYGNTVNLRQDPDVLDTWFSSTIVPFATLGWPENTEDMARHYPLTLMETGHDILMFWVTRMVMLSLELTQRLPFKEVLLHGVLCDGNGKKMSKSSGNVISPENIINGCTFEELNEQARRSHAAGILSAEELQRTLRVNTKTYSMGIPDCGTDALRLSLCARNIKNHTINFDVDDCRTSKYFCNKIWQASKYVLLMTKEDQQHENVEKENLNDLDRWILSRLSWMVEIVNNAFAERNFHKAITAIRQFLYYEFCDFYVEGTKFGFRSGNSAGHSNTLAKCLEVSLRILAPVTPYLSDDLYVRLAKKGLPGFLSVTSLLETSYPMPYEFKHLRDIGLEERIRELMDVTNAIRSCMANVSKKSNPEVNILVNNVRDYNFYRENVNLIKGASKIWNVPIHLIESANDGNFNRMMTRDNNSDGDGVCTVQYMHTNDCSLLITAMDTSVLEQVKKNITKNKSKSMC